MSLPFTRFHAELPLLTEFREVTQPERFAPLPPDWLIDGADGGFFAALVGFKERVTSLK